MSKIITPAQAAQIYEGVSNSGKFNKGYLDLKKKSLNMNRMLLPGSSISGWFKHNVGVNSEPVLVSANGIRLLRNNNKIAVHQTSTKQCILWNKLGSAAEVANSEIGPNMTAVGSITYQSAKFSGGAYCARTSIMSITSTGVGPLIEGKSAFTIEWWQKYVDISVTAGIPSVDMPHVFAISSSTSGATPTISLLHRNSANKTYFTVSPNTSATYFQVNAMTPDIAIGDLVHWAVLYDANGIDGGSDNVRVYYYNQTSGQSATYLQNVATGTATALTGFNDRQFRFGRAVDVSNLASYNNSGVVDNVKIWNYAKTDFFDKNIEDAANYVEGDNGIILPNDNQYHHYAMRVNLDRTYDLFLDGVKEYSSVTALPEELFIDWEDRLKPNHHIRLDEASGTIAYDSGSTGGANGTYYVSAVPGAIGKNGNCAAIPAAAGDNSSRIQSTTGGIIGNRPRTISIWLKAEVSANTIPMSLSGTQGTGTQFGVFVAPTYIDIYGQGDDEVNIPVTVNLMDLKWHLLSVTWNGLNPGTINIYIDGVLNAVRTASAGRDFVTSAGWVLGDWASYTTGDRQWNGWLDDFRIYSRVLSAEEQLQLYHLTNSYFVNTPEVTIGENITGRISAPVHHWPLNERVGNITDIGTGSYGPANVQSNVVPAKQTIFGGVGSVFRSAVDAYAQYTSVNPADMWGPGVTHCFWVYMLADPYSWPDLRGYVTTLYPISVFFYNQANNTDMIQYQFAYDTGSYQGVSTNEVKWESGKWYHIAFTDSGTEQIAYVNGQLSRKVTRTKTPATTAGALYIGQTNATAYNIDSILRDIKVFNFAATPDEVRQLYNFGRTAEAEACDLRLDYPALNDFEISEAAQFQTSIDQDRDKQHLSSSLYPGTVFTQYKTNKDLVTKFPRHWFKLENDTKDYGYNPTVLTNVGGLLTYKTGPKGENSYLMPPLTNGANNGMIIPNMQYGALTACVWVKLLRPSNHSFIFGKSVTSGRFYIMYNTNNSINWGTGSTFVTSANNVVQVGKWHHIALAWNGSTWNSYIDGAPSTTLANNTGVSGSATYLIAHNGNSEFYGYVRDVQIYDTGLSAAEVLSIYKYGAIISDTATLDAYPELLMKEKIQAINENRWKGKTLTELQQSISDEQTRVITAEDF